jgi:hypothetical protein
MFLKLVVLPPAGRCIKAFLFSNLIGSNFYLYLMTEIEAASEKFSVLNQEEVKMKIKLFPCLTT